MGRCPSSIFCSRGTLPSVEPTNAESSNVVNEICFKNRAAEMYEAAFQADPSHVASKVT